MRNIFITLLLLLNTSAFAAVSTVNIDASSDEHFYQRDMAFGTNFLGEWTDFKLYRDNVYRFQQAGTRFLRFPGGSNSNEYHWNGDGYYDGDKVWHINNSPNVTSFQRGFYNLSVHRGSSSIGYGKPAVVTDGDLDTYWLSYPGAEGLQWVYIDIQTASYQPVAVTRIVIDWGDPYAAQYKIQYSNANWNLIGQWAYNDTAWTDTTQNNVTGTGGQADLSFDQVSAKYVRVLCQSSSSAGGQIAVKEIKLFGPAGQITNNVNSVAQTPSVASSMALGDVFHEYDTMDFEQFIGVAKSMTPHAEPMITINFFTGTVQEAAGWVYYANVHKGYNIKYWEIGNENWGNWESGGPCDPVNYAKRFIALYDAMTAVDPSIIIAPQFNGVPDRSNVTMTAGNNPGDYDHYIDTFLKYLADNGRAGILKGLSVHKYPSWMPAAEATPLAQVDLWDTEVPMVKSWINNRCSNPEEVKIWLTEYNDGIDSGFTNRFYNSLFVTAFTLNFLKNGGDYTCFFRPFGTPGPGQTDKTIFSDFGYLEGGGLYGALADNRCQPRSSFYAFEMMYNRFSAADEFGNTLVAASSSLPSLKVYANRRGDRKLSIAFINTDQSNTVNAAVSITGFTPLSQAEEVSYTRQNYSWVYNGTDSYANPNTPPEITSYSGAAQNFTFVSPPYSVKILTLYDSLQPTLVPSNTPTMLPTPTITPTPFPNGGALVDDCEDGDLRNLWGGHWSVYGDNLSLYPRAVDSMTCDSGGALDSSCYMRVTGTVLNGTWGFGVNCPLNSSWNPTDISMYDGIFFYCKGTANSARMAMPQYDSPVGNFGADFMVNTYWAYYELPFSSLVFAVWATPGPVWTGQNIQAVQFQPDGGYAGETYREICVDSVGFYRNTPTPEPTVLQLPASLTDVRALPSLCMLREGCSGIRFTGLTAKNKISIYSLEGSLVHHAEAQSADGTYFWKIAGIKKGKAAAPGIYIYVIQGEDGSTVKGKAAVVR